jgi:hypothetical protein
MQRFLRVLPATLACLLVAGTGCTSASEPAATPTVSTELTETAEPAASARPSAAATSALTSPATPSWPTPEDCVSYRPTAVTVHYEAGVHSVNEGDKIIMRLHGGPDENVGEQGLALARRFSEHCFLGRDNGREDRDAYIFDYWRNPSGMDTSIPDEQDACSTYDRGNLRVENMGGGHGWRVKDDDHVLHVFDTETDARDGRLVLSKYTQICFLGQPDDDQAVVSYQR